MVLIMNYTRTTKCPMNDKHVILGICASLMTLKWPMMERLTQN